MKDENSNQNSRGGGFCLCINGSDSMGHAGIQADIRTVKDLGGSAATVITSVTVQNYQGITLVHNLPTELVVGQLKAVYEEKHPDVVKVGMINNPDTIKGVRREIVGSRKVVCSPVILSSYGGMLMDNDALKAYCLHLLPICSLLIVKCLDAEIILGRRISTDSDMVAAAAELHEMGAEYVLLRGGTYAEGRINALLYSPHRDVAGGPFFFSSANIDGWQRHGVGGTLSTAIATRLAMGDTPEVAVENAHNYLHSQVVYASAKSHSLQPQTIYNRFMSILAADYVKAHDVAYYAAELCVSTRYLSQITNSVCGRSPKQIIDSYIVQASIQMLNTTTLTIQQISLQLGFASQIAFTKFFKAKKGCSPTAYRDRASFM